jgi:hypothetical protein
MSIGEARSVTDEAASLDELAPLENRRDGIACGQTYNLLAPAVEERIGADDEGVRAPPDKCGKSRLELGSIRAPSTSTLCPPARATESRATA